jgi:predicted permease
MQTLWNDLRYALRQLRNAPGFTLTAVLTLALGIGVTATVFSVVRQVLLAPLPYPQAERLVGVAFAWPGGAPNADQTGDSAEFLMRTSRSFQASTLISQSSTTANLSGKDGHASSVALLGVSRGYFDTLGAVPALGRAFTEEEDRPGGPQALVLSYGLWQRAFGGDPSVVGRTLRLNQESIVVVGVMPANFHAETYASQHEIVSPDAWRPLKASPKDPGYEGHNYQMYARLRPGVTLAQAQGEIQALDAALYRADPYYKTWQDPAGQLPHCHVWPLATVVAGGVHESLVVMTGASVAVLLLACLNLAGLNTARALRRASEFALRTALGATRWRLVRLAVLETMLVSLAGVAGAVLAARLLLPFLLGASPIAIPQLNGAAGAWSTLGQAGVLGLLSAVLFGAPLAIVALAQGRSSLQPGARQAGGTRRQQRASRTLLVLQMSLAVILLSTASLLLGTFLRLRAQPLGFAPEKLVVFQTNLKGERYSSTLATGQFVQKVLARLGQSPGVSSAAAINGLPLDRGLNTSGHPDGRSQLEHLVESRAVTPGYFRTMKLPLLEGRDIRDSDGPSTMPAIVVGSTAARRWWPGRSPVGSSVQMGKRTWRVVGVVADAPGRSLAESSIMVYEPLAQLSDDGTKMLNGWFPTSFVVKLAARIDAGPMVRKAVADADAEIPVAKLTTMQQVVDNSVAAPRFFTELAEGFAAFGVLLTAIGLFGLLSYQVAQRTREIGIRMALGASRGAILRGVVAGSALLALTGAALGGVGALLLQPLLTRWIAENVIGTESGERSGLLFNGSIAVMLAIGLLLVTALAAALLPARRAARVEPMEALRTE